MSYGNSTRKRELYLKVSDYIKHTDFVIIVKVKISHYRCPLIPCNPPMYNLHSGINVCMKWEICLLPRMNRKVPKRTKMSKMKYEDKWWYPRKENQPEDGKQKQQIGLRTIVTVKGEDVGHRVEMKGQNVVHNSNTTQPVGRKRKWICSKQVCVHSLMTKRYV